jgi:hypothetical protein
MQAFRCRTKMPRAVRGDRWPWLSSCCTTGQDGNNQERPDRPVGGQDDGPRPAVLREQDHDQAASDPVWAVQQGEQVAGVVQERFAYTLETHTGAAS